MEQARKEHIDYLVDEIMPIIFNRVLQDGYNLGSDVCNNSTILFVEAFKSAMCESVGSYHPLQEISNNMQFSEDIDDSIAVIEKEREIDITGLQPVRRIESDDAIKDR